jgi:hypothetical protein
MAFAEFDFEALTAERRTAIAKSIRVATPEELKQIGDEIFRFVDDPWREVFFEFIKQNQSAAIHHAVTNDGVHILYCRGEDKGMWFLPGSGKGPLPERGRQAMNAAIEKTH